MNETPFLTLLYRYFFFNWLFRWDPDSGSLPERAARVRHNRHQARWLPTYMVRWLCCGSLLYGLADLAEHVLGKPSPAVWLYAASAMCVSFAVTIATAWVGLTQRQEI